MSEHAQRHELYNQFAVDMRAALHSDERRFHEANSSASMQYLVWLFGQHSSELAHAHLYGGDWAWNDGTIFDDTSDQAERGARVTQFTLDYARSLQFFSGLEWTQRKQLDRVATDEEGMRPSTDL